MKLSILNEGIIWKNRALVAAKGNSVALGNGEILHSFQLGTSRQSPDVRCMFTRSLDYGKTWSEPIPFSLQADAGHTASTAWFSWGANGALWALANCNHNVGKDHSRWKKENGGWIGTDSYWCESTDRGRTWSKARPVVTPSPPGGFSVVSSPLIELASGERMIVIEPMFIESVENLHHEAAVVFSKNGVNTWGDKAMMANDPERRIFYFDPRIARLKDGRFVAFYWSQDTKTDQSLQTTIGWSDDGHSWTKPRPVPLWGFLTLPLVLADGRLLAVYNHRRDPQGIRCAVSKDNGVTWDMESEHVLWDQRVRRIVGERASESIQRKWEGNVLAEMFTSFQFGVPHPIQLDDGSVIVSFYATLEDGVTHQRFVRIRIE